MGTLLEQNYLILNQYKQNMQQYKVNENTDLLVRFRDNIVTILSQMNNMSGEDLYQMVVYIKPPLTLPNSTHLQALRNTTELPGRGLDIQSRN